MSLFNILPVEVKFFDCFNRSADTVLAAARDLRLLLTECEDIKLRASHITAREHIGDKIVHETMALLSRTFLTPIENDEIRALVSRLDDVLDNIEAAAQGLLLYEVHEPIPEARELAELLVSLAEQIAAAVPLLAHKERYQEIHAYTVEINRLENAADRVQYAALARLVKDRGDWFELFRWKEIIAYMEDAADSCEDVADVLATVVQKSA
jgi:uncharacterized protein